MLGKCLLCFTVNRQTFNILNTHLQQVLEIILDSEIEAESLFLCFICHKRMQQCFQLMQLAKTSQYYLNNKLTEKIDVDFEKHQPLLELTTSKLQNISISQFKSHIEEDVEVKKEYLNVDEMEQQENDDKSLECTQGVTEDPLKDISSEHDDLKHAPTGIKTEVEGVSIEYGGESSPLPAGFEEQLVQLEELTGEFFYDGNNLAEDIPDIVNPSHVNPLTQPKTTIPSALASDSLATTRNSPKAQETNLVDVFTQLTTPMPSSSPISWFTNDGESVNLETPSQTSIVKYARSTHKINENMGSPPEISSVSHVHSPFSVPSSRKKAYKTDKGKKRLVHQERWLVVQRKLKKNSGEEFVNKKGQVVESKQLKDPCTDKCRLKCSQKISHEDRKRVFKYFWLLGDKKKHWEFVIKNTKKSLKRRQTTEVTKHDRQNTYQYFLPDAEKKLVKVCKTMFLNTIALSERVVKTAWKKFDGNTVIEDDKRGRYKHERRVYNDDMVKSVCDHVRCFPVVEAHYIHKNSNKLYLKGIESVSRMYKLYCEWFDATKYYSKATTKRQYREVVNANFNLALHRPKKK